MARRGCPTENGIIERFVRTLKKEHIDYTKYASFNDAVVQIEFWMEIEYMTESFHSTLDYLKPSEFELAHVSV